MKAVINQPTYIPWMGYFAMIDVADIFVFYDDVQFEAQSWQQRNRIKTGNGIQTLTIPIKRSFGQKINEVQINTDIVWRKNHWRSIEQAYSKAPFWNPYGHYVEEMYQIYFLRLCDLTIYSIRWLSELLDVAQPRFIKSSELQGITGQKTDRVLSVLKKVGADEYISGPAAKAYLDEDKFKKAGIKLTWFEYEHPVYPQIRREFVSHLSVLDLLFNTGGEAIEFIRRGNKTGT